MSQRVYIGLSGGVDSAVSAALLKEAGYNVTGVFIKIWSPEFIECTWREDRLDAMRVAAQLEIPFKEIDLSREYRESVVGDMVRNYQAGRTPNPDVLCNRFIKFGAFFEWARRDGAEYVATGHYARIDNRHALLRGADRTKDQSYFLYLLGPADLAHVLFPVGGLEKSAVRETALRLGLANAGKPDSQGLCFVGDITLPEFLARFIPLARGDVLDISGKVIGIHDGAALYTIGQRHGFTVQGASTGPRFVVAVDAERNTITVDASLDRARVQGVELADPVWHTAPEPHRTYDAACRYREAVVPITVKGNSIRFAEPHLAAPGQALVVYDGDRVVGGGVIERTDNSEQ